MNRILIDADFYAVNHLERFVLENEEELGIKNKVDATMVFYNHQDIYKYLQIYLEEVKTCFIKIAQKEELEILKKMQKLESKAFFSYLY
ncbi:hypothetical protein [Lactococcus lactis]|uniref:hypothetical protein n=1 Tax=Lactococcus lactis TaxID=1358 RepID=UPI001EF071A3|nr:hypothetical protein [Lactococcus lactis]